MAIAYHTHTFTIPTASDAEAETGVIDNKALVPANLPPILATKQDLSTALTSISGLTTSANQTIYTTAENAYATTSLTSIGRDIIGGASAAAIRELIDAQQQFDSLDAIGALSPLADRLPYFTDTDTAALTTFTSYARTLLDDADAATAQQTLGLEPGVDVQPYEPILQEFADLTLGTEGQVLAVGPGSALEWTAAGAGDLVAANNLSDVADESDARINLGLGDYVQNVVWYGAVSGGSQSDLATAFQAAIDALPSTGGTIILPDGDWSNLDPTDLTIATNQMVTFEALTGAVLPDGIAASLITQGYRLQPYENSAGTGARPGAAFTRYIVSSHVPDVTQASQQDSILYVEGHSPAVEGNLAQEFAALRFNMSSQMFDTVNSVSNVDIKGVQGVAVGDTGNAKVRSIRTTSVGINGHYGLVTGIMGAAHRSGVIPTESPFNGNGTDEWTSGVAGPYLSGDAAIIGQVGPGIQAALRLEGFAGLERPQFGVLQAKGAQALAPEIAFIDMHGEGNGRMIRGLRSLADSTEVFAVTKEGYTKTPAIMSSRATVADDAVLTITPPATTGFVLVFAEGTSSSAVGGYFRVGASPAMTQLFAGASGAVLPTGTMTGTTGTDGRLTISSLSDGTMQFENRTGASRSITWLFICGFG